MPLNNPSTTAKTSVFTCRTLPMTQHSAGICSLFVLFFLLLSSMQGHAQCIGFAKNIARPLLGDFVHDGNYSATILGEGESAELYKTFFEGVEYRLVVAGVNTLPQIRITVTDMHKMVLFDNAHHNFSQKWDFYMQTTQKLVVKIKVLENDDAETNTGGCVAILFGVKE